ncbi:unnamed protein product, partial [Polarella glacialis]
MFLQCLLPRSEVRLIIHRPQQLGAKEYDMQIRVRPKITVGQLQEQLESQYGLCRCRQVLCEKGVDERSLDPSRILTEDGQVLQLLMVVPLPELEEEEEEETNIEPNDRETERDANAAALQSEKAGNSTSLKNFFNVEKVGNELNFKSQNLLGNLSLRNSASRVREVRGSGKESRAPVDALALANKSVFVVLPARAAAAGSATSDQRCRLELRSNFAQLRASE